MKKLFWLALVLITCLAAGSALATEAPQPQPATQLEAEAAPAEAMTDEVDAECEATPANPLQLESPLDVPVQNVCSCRDLCKNDRQCGEGGVCLPTGPCACKQCFYSS